MAASYWVLTNVRFSGIQHIFLTDTNFDDSYKVGHRDRNVNDKIKRIRFSIHSNNKEKKRSRLTFIMRIKLEKTYKSWRIKSTSINVIAIVDTI
jgi:hypothetical protein